MNKFGSSVLISTFFEEILQRGYFTFSKMKEYVMPFLYLLLEMAPYLLLGFFIAGLLHSFVPQRWYRKYLGRNDFHSVALSLLFGIPLPLCSCGVIPTAVGMRREGASKGAVTAFLIGTPQTGVDSIAATWSVLGLPFAILRPVAALVTGMFGGLAANAVARSDESRQVAPIEAGVQCACRQPLTKSASPDYMGKHIQQNANSQDLALQPQEPPRSFLERLREALRYGFSDMIQDIGRWLVIGLILAGLINIFVPDGFFTTLADKPLLNMMLVLAIAIPMYVCATGSIPIAAALMLKGLSPGAALVFLMAGPATNVASIMVLGKTLGRKHLLIYLGSIIVGAITFGLAVDYLLPQQWFTQTVLDSFQSSCCHSVDAAIPWWKIASALLLAVLLIRALILRFTSRKPTKSYTMKFKVTGMMCNHCRANVLKAIEGIEGVSSAEVDLASGSATVEGSASAGDIIAAVRAAGYECVKQ